MPINVVLGYVFIPLALLAAAYLINRLGLWDFLGNLTMPWMCTAVAVAVLLQGAMCLVLQTMPVEVPERVAALFAGAVLVIFGAGLIVDRIAYGKLDHWAATVGTWVGFAVVLSGVFALPYVV